MMSEIKLPGTPFTALARQRGKAKGLDFEGGRERAERDPVHPGESSGH
jgi:hypothetical protein